MIPFFSFLYRAFRSMLRREWFPGLLVVLLTGFLALVLATSCFFPTGPGKAKPAPTARVVVTVSEPFGSSMDKPRSVAQVEGSRGLVYDPAPLPGDLQVFLQGAGPGGALLAPVPVMGPALELKLCAGDWVFQARAVDGEGAVFLAGTTAATVHPATGARVAITLSPLPGLGTLAVAYSAPLDVSSYAVWNCNLTDKVGSSISNWEDLLAVSGRTVADIPAGYYLLGSRLLDGQLLLAGRVDLVRVLAGRSTSAMVALAVPEAGAGINLELDHRAPVALTATLLSRVAVRGFPLRVRATGPAGGASGISSGADFWWSAMGTALAQGELADIPTLGLPRSGVIDLIAFSGTSAGAASLAYSLVEPPVRDGWCLYATVGLAEEPTSQVLGRPAMVAASLFGAQAGGLTGSQTGSGTLSTASGPILAVASDGTSSKLELWQPDPYSGELVPGASTTVRIGGTARKASILAISGDGSYVGAAASESGWIWLVPVASDGKLGTPVELVGGSGDLSGLGYVRGLALSPSADRLYALSNSDRSVYVFQRIGLAWSLLQRFTLDDQPCGTLSVLRTLALSSDGSRLAVAAASSDVVVILDVVEQGLSWRSEARRTAGFPDIDYPQVLAFSPGEPADGTSGGWPEGSPPANRLAVGCKDSAALVILDIEAVPPAVAVVLKAPEGLPGVPASLSWSADGFFIGLSSSGAVAILRLDAAGQPQGIASFGVVDAAGLAAPAGLAMVGNQLYVPCPDAQALVILGRLPE
jgi:DNA-binding beta-propeller fold protein YncE